MKYNEPVLLVGNGPIEEGALALAASFTGLVIAADGGAETALGFGLELEATIGDMDSVLVADSKAAYGELHPLSSQNTTDFEKCLSLVDAPVIIGVGFLGGRLDHSLAALNALARSEQPVVLIGEVDLVFLLPENLSIALPIGTRISFFPMGDVRGVSSNGLVWELTDLALSPNAGISTSNQIAAANLDIFNPMQPLLCILPRETLAVLLKCFNSYP